MSKTYVWIALYARPITRPGRKPKVGRVVARFEAWSLWARPFDGRRYTFRLAVDEGERFRFV